MKKNSLRAAGFAVVLIAGLVWLGFGCGKPAGSGETGAKSTVVPVSVERTSFTEVTSQLDPGGNFYLYLGTAQWLEHLSTAVDSLRTKAAAIPGMTPENAANLIKGFDLADRLIKDSGIEDVTGVGLSSIEIEDGMYRNKMLLHHYPGAGTGFLWKLGGEKSHPLTSLDLLPANTALATFADVDFRLLWKVTQDEVAQSGFPQAQTFLTQFPIQFEARTKMKWDAVVNSLGGEVGFILTLDESNTVPIPVGGNVLTIPEPGLVLVVKINDDTLFDRIDHELQSNSKVVSVEEDDLRMRTLPSPIPFLRSLRPSAASSGGYLFISSSDTLINDCLAAKAGKVPGLKSTAEFKHLSENIPDQGNQFAYISERFGRVMAQVQQQLMSAQMGRGGSAQAQAQWVQSLLMGQSNFGYSVGAITPEGCLTVGNSHQSLANLALIPAVAVPAMLSAVAIPNFVKARSTSQENTCINNLRQLDAAKNQWALEKHKQPNDVPTKEDLLPYLRRWPVCPAGGQYTIGSVSEPPRCSIPGHRLP